MGWPAHAPLAEGWGCVTNDLNNMRGHYPYHLNYIHGCYIQSPCLANESFHNVVLPPMPITFPQYPTPIKNSGHMYLSKR